MEEDRFEELERLAERFLGRPPVQFEEWETLKGEIEQSLERHAPR